MKKIFFLLLFFAATTLCNAQYVADGVRIIQSYGSATAFDTTSLGNLASSQTVGWQSDRISNLSTIANDYEIFIKMQMKAGAPANDKAVYIYANPFYTTDGGSTWFSADGGTTTLPSGTRGSYTIASPNDLTLLAVLNYTTSQQPLQKTLLLSNAFGKRIPDAFGLVIVNFSGVADSTVNVLSYKPLY